MQKNLQNLFYSLGVLLTLLVSVESKAQTVTLDSTKNVTCNGAANGAIYQTFSGFGSPLTIGWSFNGSPSALNTEDITMLAPGTYQGVVTDGINFLTFGPFTITEPALALSANLDSLVMVKCKGGSTGGVYITPVGGTAPYTYLWTNGVTTQNNTGLVAGTYNGTITDANGCTFTSASPAVITEPSLALSANLDSLVMVKCKGGSTGGVYITPVGGTAPYTYLWTNGVTTQNNTGLVAGTYNGTITDAKGCTFTSPSPAVITEPALALSASLDSVVMVKCKGGSTGGVYITPVGGTAPYTYLWTNGVTTQNNTGLVAGTYNGTITDAKGCTFTSPFPAIITEPALALSATVDTFTNVSCYQGSNGTISITTLGGTSPYTHSWSNGSTTEDISGLVAGSYTDTITDSKGCTFITAAVTITEPLRLRLSGGFTAPLPCFGDSGNVIRSIIGGTAPYHISWTNTTQTTPSLYNVKAGRYDYTLTDTNGCVAIGYVRVNQNDSNYVVVDSTKMVSCKTGTTGEISISLATDPITYSNNFPYTHAWSNGATTEDLTALPAGTYTDTITDVHGCKFLSTPIVITEPALALTATVDTFTNVSCYQGSNGTVSVTTLGGTSPYTHSWSNGTTTEDLTGLVAGSYTDTITDSKGCTFITAAVTITEPLRLRLSGGFMAPLPCFGDSGNVIRSIIGGTAPYHISWTNTTQTTPSLYNVKAGRYDFTLTDTNSCVTVGYIRVNQNDSNYVVIDSTKMVSCKTGTTGAISISLTTDPITYSNNFPYTHAWSNGATTEDLTALPAGTYTDTITDVHGCKFLSTPIVITEPALALSATIDSVKNLKCAGDLTGAIYLTPVGGTSPYSHLWSQGQTTEDITGLSAYTDYVDTIMDSKGCKYITPVTRVTQPFALFAIPSMSPVSCNGLSDGSIDLMIMGGTAPFKTMWSNGDSVTPITGLATGKYTATITDAHGCISTASDSVVQPAVLSAIVDSTKNASCFGGNNGVIYVTALGGTAPYMHVWSNGDSVSPVQNLVAGSYKDSITDANGCIVKTSAITISQPTLLTTSIDSVHNLLCGGAGNGQVFTTVMGGTSPYTYKWNNGLTVQDPAGLNAGTFMDTVTDAHGCKAYSAIATVVSPATLSMTVDSLKKPSCVGATNGDVYITVLGGTTPYTYSWSNTAVTQDLTMVGAASYSVSVVDGMGCTMTNSTPIVLTAPSVLTMTVDSIKSVVCYGQNNGAAYISVNGGTTPYTYNWSNLANTQDVMNLSAGSYSVTVKDMNNCTMTNGTNISVPTPAAITSVSTIKHANTGGGLGTIDVTAVGGTAPYSFHWSNGDSTAHITNLPKAVYYLTITDSHGCPSTRTDSVVIINTAVLELEGNANLAIYPNPTTSTVYFDLQFENAKQVTIEILDLTGRVVLETPTQSILKDVVKVNLSDLAGGIYLAKINIDNKSITRRIQLNK